ncbi:MAG: DNA polymerase III subunit gamma/tau [Chloroflexi bacterium]|nr:DNA polymerase III subunit gamma/tau [Chloroflexota bacterium]
MSQALYRKWRPARFEDVIGQDHITNTLQNSVAADRVGHAYLFCGPRGTGKTTSARLLAKAVNCTHDDLAERPCNTCHACLMLNDGRFLDLIEIDAASNTGVDDMRALRDKINFSPNEGRFKVYIIDEVHMLSTAAFNALLKTLEEPPSHVMFILATTEEHKVPITIKSRCQQFNFRLLTIPEIIGRLKWLSGKEDFTIEPDALGMIARQGAGSLRDAESLLDQLVVSPGDVITAERTQMVLGTASNTAVISLTDAWLNSDGATGLQIIHDALGSGTDARQFCRQMVVYMRQLLLLHAAGKEMPFDGTDEQRQEMLIQAQRASRQGLIAAIKTFNEAALTSAGSWQPQLPLELAFIEMLPDAPAPMVAFVPQPAPVAVSPAVKKEVLKAEPVVEEKVETKTAVTPIPEAVKPEPEPKIEEAVVETAVVEVETAVADPQSATTSQNLPLEAVTGGWRDLVNQAGQVNRNLIALLNMGKPLATEGNTLVLGFDFPIFKEKFDNTQGAGQLVSEIMTQLTGIKSNIRCVVTSEYSVNIGKDDLQSLAQELGGVVEDE